jgi:hypothetical protein
MSSLSVSCYRAFVGIALLAALQTGCATSAVKPQVRPVDEATSKRLDGSWIAVVGEDRAFKFIGEYRDSTTNNGYQMLYPAPNFAGFLVGVATHAALQSAQSNALAEEQLRSSNEVLEPYQQVLGEIFVHSAFERALQMRESSAKIVVSNEAHGMAEPEVDLAAQAIMAQSSRALIVDLVAKVKDISVSDDTSEYVHKVRVVSNPIEANEDKINDYWLADGGHRLKQAVSSLLARAIDLFIADATQHLQPLQDKQITARYQFGNERRTERAIVLEQSCMRETLRTLRGWVLSVPVLDSLKHQRDCTDTEVTLHGEVPPA